MGSSDASYLGSLVGNPRFILHTMPDDEWATIAGWGVHRRCSYNYWRCLDYFATHGGDLCLCEDDVVFAEGFWTDLAETVEDIEQRRQEYVLALYSTADLNADPSLRRGKKYACYHAQHFFGTQGMYFPAAVLPELAARMRRDGVDEPKKPCDLVIQDVCYERQYLFGSRSSLVQHVGRVSTGLGHFHSSPTFGRS